MIHRCAALCLLVCSVPSYASWSGEASLGYLSTSGNTSTQSLNGKFALAYTASSWKNELQALGVYTTDEGDTTAERYAASDKVDWRVTDRDYIFAVVDWEKDLFGGIRERTSETVGYGRHVLTGPKHLLDLELGAGARQLQDQSRERSNEAIGRFSGKYQCLISETSKFTQTVKVESGDANTYAESVSELKLSIIGNLFASLSYTVRHNTEVPVGTERTDTSTAVNVSYAFGQ